MFASIGTLTVISVTTGQVETSFPVGANPQDVATSPDGAKIYVVNSNDRTLSIIDARTYAVGNVPLPMCATRVAVQPATAGLKHLNRLEQVLARREWSDPAVHDGLMLDTDGLVAVGGHDGLAAQLEHIGERVAYHDAGRHRRAFQLEAQVVMQSRGPVLLDHERPCFFVGHAALGRFGRRVEVALVAVGLQGGGGTLVHGMRPLGVGGKRRAGGGARRRPGKRVRSRGTGHAAF